jgi:hypothetical protein
MVWISEKRVSGDSVSEAILYEKAKHLYSGITRDTLGAEEFKASKRWFHNFEKRIGFHIVVRVGETASVNKDAAKNICE